MNTFDDKRLFERFTARFPARTKDSRENFGSKFSLRDASAQGARFSATEKVLLNDKLSLEVDVPGKSLPMSLSGEVIWTRQGENNAWDIGIKFNKPILMHMSKMYEMMAPSHR